MMVAFPPLAGYRSKKAAQIAAIFVRSAGGRIDKLKLIKLLYIAERESLRLRGRPMLYDELYSLKDGPICSSTLNAINGGVDVDTWSKYIKKDGKTDIYVVSEDESEFQDEISASDMELVKSVIKGFMWMTTSQVRNWTHDARNCPEYTEVENNSRLPISYFDLANAVGCGDPLRSIGR
jgi:uncharacterized phage-associated protein